MEEAKNIEKNQGLVHNFLLSLRERRLFTHSLSKKPHPDGRGSLHPPVGILHEGVGAFTYSPGKSAVRSSQGNKEPFLLLKKVKRAGSAQMP